MSVVCYRCPETGEEVTTAIETSKDTLVKMRAMDLTMWVWCPHCMAWHQIKPADLGLPEDGGWSHVNHVSVKEAVMPFDRFSGADALLGPEMRSTGEVMAGGRTAVDHDAISYDGDEAVGKRIVEHLNYVI